MTRLLKNNVARTVSAGLVLVSAFTLTTFLARTFADSEHLIEMAGATYNADGSVTLERYYQVREGGDGKYKSFAGQFIPDNNESDTDSCIEYFSPDFTIAAGSKITSAGATVNVDTTTGEFSIQSDEGIDLVEDDEIVRATFTLSSDIPFNTLKNCGVLMENNYVMLDGTDELSFTTDWENMVSQINKNKSQEIAYDETAIFKDSTDDDFTNPLTETTVEGAISYASSDESVATVDPATGLVHIVGDGTTTITATAAAAYDYMSASASYDLYVGMVPISITDATVPDKVYDGTLDSEVGIVTLSEAGLVQGVDYTATAVFDDANVGTDKTVTVTVTLSSEAAETYVLPTNTFVVDDVTITPHTLVADDIFLEYYVTDYNATEKEPEVTVKIGNFTVDPDEYTVVYGDNVNPGTATVTVTAKDGMNISSEAATSFEIIDNRSILEITGIPASQTITYTGDEVVLEGDLTVGDNTDGITVDDLTAIWYVYENGAWVQTLRPADLGEYKVRYYYDGPNYIGELVVTFEIVEPVTPVTPDEPEKPEVIVPDTGRFTATAAGNSEPINITGILVISGIILGMLAVKIGDRKAANAKIDFDKK